jgi:hypothetical protein
MSSWLHRHVGSLRGAQCYGPEDCLYSSNTLTFGNGPLFALLWTTEDWLDIGTHDVPPCTLGTDGISASLNEHSVITISRAERAHSVWGMLRSTGRCETANAEHVQSGMSSILSYEEMRLLGCYAVWPL